MTIKIEDYSVSYTEQNHDPITCYTLTEAKKVSKQKLKEYGERVYITAFGYDTTEGPENSEIQDSHGWVLDTNGQFRRG